jgi:hypothetical protein
LFLGHFVALQTGFDADVRMIPGQRTNEIQMIQFDLDKKENSTFYFRSRSPARTFSKTDRSHGSIDVTNTLDWRTQMRVDDPRTEPPFADISMNKPYSYRGYRFFQAQTIPVGKLERSRLILLPKPPGKTASKNSAAWELDFA